MHKVQTPFLGIGVANSISILRVLLCFVVVSLLFSSHADSYPLAFVLTIVVIWMDGLDGYAARKLGESSPVGAVIDILSDRIVEQVYWISFAVLGWIPLWMPLLVVTRGVCVDGLRALALQEGYTAFGQSSMMQTWWGILLTSSRFSRWTYAVTKAMAFAFLILAHQAPETQTWVKGLPWIPSLANACVWGAVVFCVLRGLPVLIESRRFLTHGFETNESTRS